MKSIKGPAIFLAQFADDAAPFNTFDSICGWAASLGYNGPESAFGGAFLANWTLSSHFTTAFRYETLHNSSTINDPSANADLVGYGPGSGINTYTITPGWSNGHAFARMDLSSVRVTSSAPGVAFGDHGTQRNQFRTMFEIGVQM